MTLRCPVESDYDSEEEYLEALDLYDQAVILAEQYRQETI